MIGFSALVKFDNNSENQNSFNTRPYAPLERRKNHAIKSPNGCSLVTL